MLYRKRDAVNAAPMDFWVYWGSLVVGSSLKWLEW